MKKFSFPILFSLLMPAILCASTLTYTHDSLGRLTGVTYDNGIRVTYEYDAMGNRLKKKVTIPATLDTDGDAIPDLDDACPFGSNDRFSDPCDHDEDRDGVPDESDACPLDPAKTGSPGQCGCGNPEMDTDGDGTADCNDRCPQDAAKTEAGICGCGTPETNSDGDAKLDCEDLCPNDPNKTDPGECGCGAPEGGVRMTFYRDADGDGFGDPLRTQEACEGATGYVSDRTDCDDSVSDVHPEAPEVCNGIDDNCAGGVDEGLGQTTCGLGPCRHTVDNCWESRSQICDPLEGASAEICEGVQDENCDGSVDEGCACINGASRACGSAVGECREGTQSCVNGQWGICAGAVDPAAERCDGKDNDCDGTSDEDYSDLGRACDSEDADRCKNGIYVCNGDGSGVTCGPETPADIVESCDGVDNDCDGVLDNGCECRIGESRSCGSDVGDCRPGVQACLNGFWGSCAGAIGSVPEICDGRDNDCNGVDDDGPDVDRDGVTDICDGEIGVSPPNPSPPDPSVSSPPAESGSGDGSPPPSWDPSGAYIVAGGCSLLR